MKTKGITIWEQHAEKMVLGLAGLLFVAIVAKQFIGSPNVVPQGGKQVGPADIDQLLIDDAERLLALMDSSARAPVQIDEPIRAASYLNDRMAEPLVSRIELAFLEPNIVPGFEKGPITDDRIFFEPVVPTPSRVAAAQFTDTLADGIVQANDGLGELFPDPNQPPDITFVTTFGVFDRAELMSQLHEEHPDPIDPVSNIPDLWYNDPLEILDVVIERQTLDDGHWTNLTTLQQIPGRSTLRPQLEEGIEGTARNQVLADAGRLDRATDIARPAFYATRNNEWIPAELDLEQEQLVGADGEREDPEIARIKRKLRRERTRAAGIVRDLEPLGGPAGSGDGGDPGGLGGGPGGGTGGDGDRGRGRGGNAGGGGKQAPPGGGGGFGAGGGDIPGRRGPPGQKRDEQRRIGLTKSLRSIEMKISQLQRDLKLLLPDADVDEEGSDEPDDGKIMVWGHDLYAEPGETYRYRVTLKLYNPFFGKKRSLTDEQARLAESFTISSDPSDWSAQITVDPRLLVYITNASAPGQRGGAGNLGLGQVTAEVYKYYDGQQWMDSFKVQPGEHIGGPQTQRVGDGQPSIEVDFSTGLYVLDIIEDIDAPPADARNSGSAATVLLQDALDAKKIQLRDPRIDASDEHRRDMRDKIRDRDRYALRGDSVP